jgi:site-specific DNA recombinase
VQEALDHRLGKRAKKSSHDFPFASMLVCGHCGCAMVGEIKKDKYIYYHCTGFKGRCPERYARQELIEAEFSRVLRQIVLDQEVLCWAAEALRQSHVDQRQHHVASVTRLKTEYNRLQARVEAAYEDRLDGRIDVPFFERKSNEWRTEQSRILRSIEAHQNANQSYMEEGILLLELASRAHELFEKQPPKEKRRLLDFVLSNSQWKGGSIVPTFRQPFDMIALANGERDARHHSALQKMRDRTSWLPKNHGFQLPLRRFQTI